MDIYGQIAQAIRGIAADAAEGSAIFPAKVKSVDGETCTIEVGNLEVSDVRLRAVINGSDDHLLRVPRVGSLVVVADMSGGQFRDLVVIEQSETERIDIAIGSTTVTIEDGQITVNGGDNGGMVNISSLTSRLNTIENDINSLKTVFSTWAPVAQDGGAALKTAAATWAGQQLTTTQDSDYEDTTVKH
jgi:hypothetical protein